MVWDLLPDPVLVDWGWDVDGSQLEVSVGMCTAERSLSLPLKLWALWSGRHLGLLRAADC